MKPDCSWLIFQNDHWVCVSEIFDLHFVLDLAVLAALILGTALILWRGKKIMSKTAELTAAVDKAVAALQAGPANTTPDAEVQAQIDKLVAATPPTP